MDFLTSRHHTVRGASIDTLWTAPCPGCGSLSVECVVLREGKRQTDLPSSADLLLGICRKCDRASIEQVSNGGATISPSPKPFEDLADLPEDVEVAWEEARAALGAGAPMAASHVLRKILFHVAVEQGLPEKNEKDHAPGFVECVAYLVDEGLVPSGWRNRLELVRKIGNDAAHELPATDSELVKAQGRFVESLLRSTYTEAAAADRAETLWEGKKASRE